MEDTTANLGAPSAREPSFTNEEQVRGFIDGLEHALEEMKRLRDLKNVHKSLAALIADTRRAVKPDAPALTQEPGEPLTEEGLDQAQATIHPDRGTP